MPTPRITIPTVIKNYVFQRDNHRCKRCGTDKTLTVDHIQPLAKGGTNDASNLQTLCQSCNSRKRDRIIPTMKHRI